MDLLDLLLQDEYEEARKRLLAAIDRDAPMLEEVTFNVFEVTLDREAREARVFDVLDGNAEPTIVTLDELRSRLIQASAHAALRTTALVRLCRDGGMYASPWTCEATGVAEVGVGGRACRWSAFEEGPGCAR